MGGVITNWHQSEVATLDLRVKVDHDIGLYVWHESMKVKCCYMHHNYMHACHYIFVVVTCMIDAS